MKVRIKKSFNGVKEGEIYIAEKYWLDPLEKVTLLSRVPDGHDPHSNAYLHEVEIMES